MTEPTTEENATEAAKEQVEGKRRTSSKRVADALYEQRLQIAGKEHRQAIITVNRAIAAQQRVTREIEMAQCKLEFVNLAQVDAENELDRRLTTFRDIKAERETK